MSFLGEKHKLTRKIQTKL